MNTGQKLVELSGLTTGTAMQHLLAITTGGGGGFYPVFGVKSIVTSQSDRLVVERRSEAIETALTGGAVVEGSNDVFVHLSERSATIRTVLGRVSVHQSRDSTSVQTTDDPTIHVIQYSN